MSKANAAGLSSARLETLDRFIQSRYIDTGKIPGALIVIARRGEVAHFSALGMADVERKKPVREDTIFRLYSMTKPLTSVAFMMLVEQGLVALDEPVHQVIPEWKDLGVYQGGFMETYRTTRPERPMLMIDLLRHTSGLTYGFQQTTNVDAGYRKLQVGERLAGATLDDMIAKIAGLPLEFSPGTAWNYSVSTDVLGYLVGKISGKPFDQFLRAHIFEPLGMNDTDFHVRRRQRIALRRLLCRHAEKSDDAVRRSREEPLSPAAVAGLGRRRRRLDRLGLFALLQDAAQWRHARRRPDSQPQDDRA